MISLLINLSLREKIPCSRWSFTLQLGVVPSSLHPCRSYLVTDLRVGSKFQTPQKTWLKTTNIWGNVFSRLDPPEVVSVYPFEKRCTSFWIMMFHPCLIKRMGGQGLPDWSETKKTYWDSWILRTPVFRHIIEILCVHLSKETKPPWLTWTTKYWLVKNGIPKFHDERKTPV